MCRNTSTDIIVLVTQSHPALCHPTDCHPSGSSVRGILRVRMLEQVAISFSRGSSPPRTRAQICMAADSSPTESLGKPEVSEQPSVPGGLSDLTALHRAWDRDMQPDHVSQGLAWRGPAFTERTPGSGGGLPGGGCFAERFHFHLRFKGFVNKISHL